MKKLKLKKQVINIMILLSFYSLIIGGVVLVNYRLKQTNNNINCVN